jgi:hypothetical protein
MIPTWLFGYISKEKEKIISLLDSSPRKSCNTERSQAMGINPTLYSEACAGVAQSV